MGFSAQKLARLGQVMSGHVQRGEVPGLVALVARRGQVHVEAHGETGQDAIFRLASLTKQIAAVGALTLLEECRLRMDDPVQAWLPELADRRVLRRPDGPLDDTEPAHRPITVEDLLTFRMGFGVALTGPDAPIQRAIAESGIGPGAEPPTIDADDYLRRLGALPWLAQPGQQWHYDTPAYVLGILMERVTGQPLGDLLAERVLGPLGMADTGFHVPAGKLHRLPDAYEPTPGGLKVADAAADSRWGRPPALASASGGLVSTAEDLLAFAAMLLHGGGPVLSRPSVALMTTDQLTDAQRAANRLFFHDSSGWGLGVNVVTRRTRIYNTPGRFGWTGGTGTCLYIDPAEDLVGILLTQVYMTSPQPPTIFEDFWTCAYQAISD